MRILTHKTVPGPAPGFRTGMAVAVALAALWVAPAGAAEPPGHAAHGARLFLQCRACHAVGQGEPAGVGPNLWGVVGAKAGARPGYHYSPALAASGIVWTPETLDQWLTRPTALVPGTNMAFQGVASASARADLIAYLESLGGKP
jgi:cytochrome c